MIATRALTWFENIREAIRDGCFLYRYRRAIRRQGDHMVCFHCLERMDFETAHVLVIPKQGRSIAVICSRCHLVTDLNFGQVYEAYQRWFMYYSGLPENMWLAIESEIVQDWMVDHGD